MITEPEDRPNHLVTLADGWSLWRTACLRGTGFPARLVLELAMPELPNAEVTGTFFSRDERLMGFLLTSDHAPRDRAR